MTQPDGPSTDREERPTFPKRLLTGLLLARAGPRSHRTRLLLTGLSLTVFVVGTTIAYTNLPPLHASPNWALLIGLLLLGVPLSVLWNAAEYHLTLKVVGRNQPVARTVRISIVAAAANLLPLPGSALVRAREIYRISGTGREVVRATATVGLAFLGTAALLTGLFLVAPGPRPLALSSIAIGVLLLLGSAIMIRSSAGRRARMLTMLVLVEAASVLTKALRYYVVLRALHFEPGAQEVFALTLMSVIALATGVFPGGIGGSELLAAAISPFIGISAAGAVMTSAIDNFAQYIGLVVPTTLVAATGAGPVSEAEERA